MNNKNRRSEKTNGYYTQMITFFFRKNLFTTIIISILVISCKTAITPTQTNYNVLNGTWVNLCDSVLVGEYKGEQVCTLLGEDAPEMLFNINSESKTLVRSSNKYDTLKVEFEQKEGKLFIKGINKNSNWIREINKFDNERLEIYYKDKTSIQLFTRKK
ncbi:hypothetical protein [Nibribacter koreensis]|uniref:Lipocalin-like domain-containing protein n=1 Tax=Nibribacter koreensis TaxID=1084519 RepID=A0ABP8F7Z7_9BACT